MWIKDSNSYTDEQVRRSIPNVSLPEVLTAQDVAHFGFEPYVPHAVAETEEQIVFRLTSAVQVHLDTTVHQRGYDTMLSACSYLASSVPTFAAEAATSIAWRDAVWSACHVVLADVKAGRRAIPTAEQLISELPAIVW